MADVIGAQPRLCVLGRLRVIDRDGVQRIPSGQPERLLLLFLAMHGGTVHTEHAIEALWPEVSPDHGRQNLRNVLSRLRQSCGPLVKREGACLVLEADTDIRQYQEALATVLHHAGLELAPDARYTDWADDLRHHLSVLAARLDGLV